jgi:hypothetical protein
MVCNGRRDFCGSKSRSIPVGVAVSGCVMVAGEVDLAKEGAYMIHQCVRYNIVVLRERFEREPFPRDLLQSHGKAGSVGERRGVSRVVRRWSARRRAREI